MALEVLLLFQLLVGADEVASSKSPLTLLEGEAMRRLLEPIEKVPEFFHIQSSPVGTGTTHIAFAYKYSLIITTEHLK